MFSKVSGIILTVVGLVLVILGAVWMTVIFPGQEKIPTNYERTLYFEGTYNVLQAGQLITIPVNVTRVQTATGTVDNVLLIDEQITVTNSATGQELPQFASQSKLAVDRSTRQNVPDYGDIPREGYWAPPSHLQQEDNFNLWNPAANQPLQASYVSQEEFSGLTVFNYTISAADLPITPDPTSGLNRVLDTQINLKIEPESGTTVDNSSLTTISIMHPLAGKTTVYQSNISFTDGTIADLVNVAQDARNQLRWFGLYIPWILIGLGGILTIAGVVVIVRRS